MHGRFNLVLLALSLMALALPIVEIIARHSEKAELQLWTASLKPYFQGYVEGVLSQWRGAEVNWVDVPLSAMPRKLIASQLAGEPPDVVNLDLNWTYSLYWAGLLQELDHRRCTHKYLPQLLRALEVRGELIALPWYVNVKVMLCNSQVLRKLGAEPPRSFEDLLRLAELSDGDLWGYWPYIKFEQDLQAYAGRFKLTPLRVQYLTPRAEKLLKSLRRLYLMGRYPVSAIEGGYTEAIALFLTGKIGCIVIGPQFIYRIREEAPEVYESLLVEPLPFEHPPITVMTLAIPKGARGSGLDLACHITSTKYQLQLSEIAPVLPSTVDGLQAILSHCHEGMATPEERARCLTAEQALRGEVYELKLPSVRWRSQLYKAALREAIVRGTPPAIVLRRLSEEVFSDLSVREALQRLTGGMSGAAGHDREG